MKLREKINTLDEKIKQHKTVRIVRIVVLLLLYAAIVLTAYFKETDLLKGRFINVVSGDSMNDTLHDGQKVFVLDQEPDYDDYVCFTKPQDATDGVAQGEQIDIIKRLIGKPGDTIEIQADGNILVNGEAIEQDYLSDEALAATYVKSDYNNVELGEDEYFILGDNRAISDDSRNFGPINKSYYLHVATTKINQQTIFCLGIIMVIILCALVAFHIVDKLLTFICYAVVCIMDKKVSQGDVDGGPKNDE